MAGRVIRQGLRATTGALDDAAGAAVRAADLQTLHKGSREAAKPAPAREAAKFREALEDARAEMDPQSRMQVSSLPENFDGSLYLSPDGMTGYAINRDGELISAFNHPSNPRRGAMDAILTSARAEGATHLHGFNNLARGYTKRGAVETDRYPWDPAEAKALTEWDTNTMGTPDYVRMDIGLDPVSGQSRSAPRRRRAPVDNTQRQAYPGIHKNPREIAAEANARLAPEDPALQELFGVTREDLFETGRNRIGNMPGSFRQSPNPRGSASAQSVMTPRNQQRLVDILSEAEAYPKLIQGTDPFYVMDPAYHRLVELVGEEEAIKRYADLNAFTGMASPGSEVTKELNRGSAANWLHRQGRFDDFEQFGGIRRDRRGPDFPEDMQEIIAHPYHSTSHSQPMRKYVESGEVQMDSPKVPPYIQASGVPQTGFQTDLPVPDAHWSRGVGLADVRTGEIYNASATTPELQTLAPWYRDIADQVGIQANPAQARQWGVMGPQTGVETPIGAPKLELMAGRIASRARELGISAAELRDKVLKGEAHMGLAGGAITAGAMGVLASPDEAEAAMNPTGPAVRAGARGVSRGAVRTPETFRKGVDDIMGNLGARGIDRETAANRILKDIEELDRIKPGLNQNFTPESKAALREELFDAYSKLQTPEKAGSPALWNKTTDIPAAGMLDEGRLSPVNPIDGDIAAGDRVWSQRGSTQFDPYAGLDQPGLPHEQMGQIISEGNELSAIAREMSRLPDSHRTNLATGRYIEDHPVGPTGPGRRYTPEEIAEYEANRAFPHPDKEMMSVGGAAGAAYAVESDARDPGVLADPTLQDDFGRIRPTAMGQALKITGRAVKAAELLQAVPGFLGDMAKHYGRMVGGGLGALATAPMELGWSQMTTGGLDSGMEALQGRLGFLQDHIPEPTGEDAITQELGELLSHPQVMRAIEDVMAWDAVKQDEAFEKGRGAYILHHMATRLPLNL